MNLQITEFVYNYFGEIFDIYCSACLEKPIINSDTTIRKQSQQFISNTSHLRNSHINL